MDETPYVRYQKVIKGWQDLVDAFVYFEEEANGKMGGEKPDGWAFRGQDTDAFPSSTLERHCATLGITGPNIVDLEAKLIRDFARRYHLFTSHPPPQKGYTMEWLSLLRHYGTPTRLVDFTYSFFIASYFALENLEKGNQCAVVWAVNVPQLRRKADAHIIKNLSCGETLLRECREAGDGDEFRALFMARMPLKFVHIANPVRLNERLTVQQGTFLAPGDVTETFEKNLNEVPELSGSVMQVIIDGSKRQELLPKLYRAGINRATLFPDLEGFAQSLRVKSLILRDLPLQDVDLLKQT